MNDQNKIKISVELPNDIINKHIHDLFLLRSLISNLIINFYEDDNLFFLDMENNFICLTNDTFTDFLNQDQHILIIYNDESQMLSLEQSTNQNIGTFYLETTNISKKENPNKNLKQRLIDLERLLIEKDKLIKYYKSDHKFIEVNKISFKEKMEHVKVLNELEKLKADYEKVVQNHLFDIVREDKIHLQKSLQIEFKSFSSKEFSKNKEKEEKIELTRLGSFPLNYYNEYEIKNDDQELIFSDIYDKIKPYFLKNEDIKLYFSQYIENFYRYLQSFNQLSFSYFNSSDLRTFVFDNYQYFCQICQKNYLVCKNLPKILNCKHYICESHDTKSHNC